MRLVSEPRQGLRLSWEEVERRRTVGLHTEPVVLIAPTPMTASARHDLARTLQQFPPAAFTAVLLGHWEAGTTLTINELHQVGDHHRPAPGRPPLTRAPLEPTTTAMLGTTDPSPTTDAPGTSQPEPAAPDATAADATAPVVAAPERTETAPDASPTEPTEPTEPTVARTPLALSVLGPVRLRYRRTTPTTEPAAADQPQPEDVLTISGISRPARELLAYLAAHPGGATRDAIIEALWPHSAADRVDTAFHTTISRLRRRLRDTTGTDTTAQLITTSNGRWHLNRTHVTVDYWTLLETHPRNPDPTLRRHDHHLAVALYQGPFAADLTGEWTHTIREAIRRRYLEAINDLTRTEINTNPDLALDLFERARNLEPLNEAIYRNIMRVHLNNSRHDDARNTYDLLLTHLDTIDAAPDPVTQKLVAELLNRFASGG